MSKNDQKNELLNGMSQISSSDTITQFMEKCNNNFFIISKIGGGPKGVKGDDGGQGAPAKPKVPIHVWREGVEYSGESILNEGYKIKSYTEDLTNVKYQEGHLILLKNGHVYILEQDDQLILKPNYIISLQSYNPDDVIDGKSAYVHIAFANSSDGYTDFILSEKLTDSDERKYMGIYSDDEESSTINPSRYTWTRIIGNTGIKGDKGDKGDQGEKGEQGQKGDKGETGAPFNGHLYTVDLEGDMSTISIDIDRTRLYDESNDYCQCIAHAYYGKNHVQLLESNINVILPSDYKYLENGDIVLASNENSKVGRIEKIQSGEDDKDVTIKFFPDSSFIFPKTSIIFKIHVEAEIDDSDNLNTYNFTRDIVWSIKGIVSTFELEIVPNYRTIKLDEFGTYFPNILTVNVFKIDDTERSLFNINENKEFSLLYKEYSQNTWTPYPSSGITINSTMSCIEFKVVRTSGSTEDSENQEEIWDYEDVWVVADGKSTHYYHADLGCTESMMVLTTGRKEEFTNSENKKMYCAELKNKSGYSITFDPKFYDGATEIKNITGVSIGQDNNEIYKQEETFVRELKPVTIDGVKKYTLTITKVPYGIDIIPMNIMVSAGDETLSDSVSFNVYISTISDIYTLVPTVSSYNTSTGIISTGTINGDTIGCSVYRNNELVKLDDLNIYGLTLNYTIHSENNVEVTKEYTEPLVYGLDDDVDKDNFTASDIAIEFILKYSGKEIVKSTVPLIKDGINGLDGDNWQYIFCRSSKYPFDQTGISYPSSWEKDEESDPDNEYFGSSESDYNTIGDDKKWYDNPKGVDSTYRYEYQSYRKWDKINKKWESYGEPTLYSYYSKDAITYNVMLSNPVAVIPVGDDDWSVNESLNENVTTQYDSTLIYLYENSNDISISKSQNIEISIPDNEKHFRKDKENGINKITFTPVVDKKAFNFGSNKQYKLPITLRYTLDSDIDNNGQNDFFETTVNWTLNPIKGLEDVEVFVDKKIVNVSTTKNQTFQVGYDLISSNGTTHVRDTKNNSKNYKIFLTNDINSLNNEVSPVSDWSSASYDFTNKDNCYVVLTDSEPIDNKYPIIDYTSITAIIDGASAIHLELTQDHIVLPCNDNGRVHGSYTGNITSQMLLYKGDVVINPKSYSFKYTNGGNITTGPNGISVKTTGTNAGTITINKSIINGDTHIDCTARYNGNSYTKTLFIDLEETPYELEIDKNILTRDGNTNNINESTLVISVKYWNSQSGSWVYTDAGVVIVTYGGTSTSPLSVDTNSTKKTRTFTIPQSTSDNVFRISYYSDTTYSKELSYETIGVVKGGSDGESTFKSTVFKRSNDKPNKPTGGSYENPVPTGWSDGIPSIEQNGPTNLYSSYRHFGKNGGYSTNDWSDPIYMSDTNEFDVEYSTIENPSNPTGHPNTNSQWSNVASEQAIWMATSTKNANGTWSDWVITRIKGEKGDTPDAPTIESIEVKGYSLSIGGTNGAQIPTDNSNPSDSQIAGMGWASSISALNPNPGVTIYILNKYKWSDGKIKYPVTSTMAGTRGDTGRVLFYLGTFESGKSTFPEGTTTVEGRLTDSVCDYYIDEHGQAWMRTGDDKKTYEGLSSGNNESPYSTYWEKAKKVGFLQANAITADMINVGDLVSTNAFIKKIQTTEIDARNIKTGKILSKKSYFDLDNGTFVLGNASGNALEYDGSKLTIGGVNDSSTNSILNRLGIVENIEIGGRNLLRYTDQSNYSDKFTGWSGTTLSLSDGWIKVTQNLESSGGAITSKDSKNDLLIKGKEYILSFDAYLENNNNDSITKLDLNYNYLMFDSGSNYAITDIATITKTPARYSIKFTYNGENTATFGAMVGANNPSWPVYYVKNIKLEQGNKATDWTPAPEDVEEEIVDAKTDAADAQKKAKEATDKLKSWSADGVITHFEVQGIKDELASILADYNEINTDYTKYGLGTPSDFNKKYGTYKGQLDTLSKATASTPVTIPSTFATNQTYYYTARTTAYNNISTGVNAYATQQAQNAVAGLEIGGRNLLARTHQLVNTNSNITSVYNTNDEIPIPAKKNLKYVDLAYVTPIIPNETEYILTFEAKSNKEKSKIYSHWYNPNTTTSVQGSQGQSGSAIDGSCLFTLTTEWEKYWVKWKQSKTTAVKNCIVARNLISQNGTDCVVYVRNVKLEQGNKATAWTPAPEDVNNDIKALEYLKEALELETDISGGLIATTTIQLRDWTGKYLSDGKTKEYKVNAGLSGKKDDNILLWGGGAYDQAIASANMDTPVITTLLKKDGTGKIGVFHIEEDQVQVHTSDGKVIIDDNEGIGCYRPQNQDKAVVLVTPKELLTFENMKKLGETKDGEDSYNYEGTMVTVDVYGKPSANFYGTESEVNIGFIAGGGTLTLNGGAHAYYKYTEDEKEISIGSDRMVCVVSNSDGEVGSYYLNYAQVTLQISKSDNYYLSYKPSIRVDGKDELTWEQEKRYQYYIGFDETDTYIYYKKEYSLADKQTMVAYKGFFSYQGEDAYFYYKDGVGLECKIGKYGIKVSKDGIIMSGVPLLGTSNTGHVPTGTIYRTSDNVLKIVP